MRADDAGAAGRAQLHLARAQRQDGAPRVEVVALVFPHHLGAQDVLELARGGAGFGHRQLDAVHSLEHVVAGPPARCDSTSEMRALHTIGHSTLPADVFAGLLRTHGIVTLADVRSVPRSRHNPQFDREALAAGLEAVGIGYAHLPALGGMRRPRPDSVNLGLRSAGFRGYADHMQTDEFRARARAAGGAGGRGRDRDHVRGGGAVAVPPRAALGRAARARLAGRAHPARSGAVEHAPSPALRTVDERPVYP